jgi:hypothetical protein
LADQRGSLLLRDLLYVEDNPAEPGLIQQMIDEHTVTHAKRVRRCAEIFSNGI